MEELFKERIGVRFNRSSDGRRADHQRDAPERRGRMLNRSWKEAGRNTRGSIQDYIQRLSQKIIFPPIDNYIITGYNDIDQET